MLGVSIAIFLVTLLFLILYYAGSAVSFTVVNVLVLLTSMCVAAASVYISYYEKKAEMGLSILGNGLGSDNRASNLFQTMGQTVKGISDGVDNVKNQVQEVSNRANLRELFASS